MRVLKLFKFCRSRGGGGALAREVFKQTELARAQHFYETLFISVRVRAGIYIQTRARGRYRSL